MLDRNEKLRRSRNRLKLKVISAMMSILIILICMVIYTEVHQTRIQLGTKVLAESVSESDDALAYTAVPINVDEVNTNSPEIVNEEIEEEIPEDILNPKFIDKFTDGEVIVTDNSYQSKNINISISDVTENGYTYHIADIYVRDILNFRTAFAGGDYALDSRDSIQNISAENNTILALTGDFYSVQPSGIVIRNGELYRDIVWGDVFVMYDDGSMESIPESEFDIKQVLQKGAYQAWSFGPMLLKDGQPMDSFNSKKQIFSKNPRSSIGYYEPGHYCFVTVDGRGQNGSDGMTLQELSYLYYDLGCTEAYNLDGGGSAKMMFFDEMVNHPSSRSREISDILYLIEIDGQ